MVYSAVPRAPLDLLPLPHNTQIHGRDEDFVAGLQEIHEAVRDNLSQANAKYKKAADKKRRHVEFDVGDLMWAILTKDRFSAGHKLATNKIGPME